MSTYVLMRILESAPQRYDLGIRWLTLGQLGKAYDRLASHIEPSQRVLDLGCGTGTLTIRAARRGARVKGIDINAQMLEMAARRVQEADLTESIVLVQEGVAELDNEAAESYDAVTSGLCLSELSEDELSYTLEQVARVLRPGGLLLVADEVKPGSTLMRLFQILIRAPLALITYLVTQQTTRAIADPSARLTDAGLSIVSLRSSLLRGFSELVARKPGRRTP